MISDIVAIYTRLVSTTHMVNPLILPIIASSAPPLAVSQAGSSAASFAKSFTGASNVAPSSAAPLKTLHPNAWQAIATFLSNRDLVRVSRVNRDIHNTICNAILPTIVLGKDSLQYKGKLGDKFPAFIKGEAAFCNAFQNTKLSAKCVPFNLTRHTVIKNKISQGRLTAVSRWGDSVATAYRNTFELMHHRSGAQIKRILDPLIKIPFIYPIFSPDGRTCVALSGRNPPLLHMFRLDSADAWQTIDCPILPLNGRGTNLCVSDCGAIFMINTGTSPHFILSLHCWEPDTNRYSSCPLEGRQATINTVSPNGKYLLLLLDQKPILVKHGAAAEYELLPLDANNNSYGCFSPDSDMLVLDLMMTTRTMFLNLAESVNLTDIRACHIRTLDAGRTLMDEALYFAPGSKSIIRASRYWKNPPEKREFSFPFTSPQAQLARANALAAQATLTVEQADVAKQQPMAINIKYAAKLGMVPGRRIRLQNQFLRLFLRPRPLQEIIGLAKKLDKNNAEERRIAEHVEAMQHIIKAAHMELLAKPIVAIRRASGTRTLEDMAKVADKAISILNYR